MHIYRLTQYLSFAANTLPLGLHEFSLIIEVIMNNDIKYYGKSSILIDIVNYPPQSTIEVPLIIQGLPSESLSNNNTLILYKDELNFLLIDYQSYVDPNLASTALKYKYAYYNIITGKET